MHLAELPKIKEEAEAAAEAEIEQKTAARLADLHKRLYGPGFRADRCNDAELAAISKNLGKEKTVDMGTGPNRTGDQDLVDYVLQSPKSGHAAIQAAIKIHKAAVASAPARVPSSMA